MPPTHGAGEGVTPASDERIAPVISLAGARAARRDGGSATDEVAADPADAVHATAEQADVDDIVAPPPLTVIEHRRPSADELRALEQQVRQIESTPPDELLTSTVDDPAVVRAARRAENVSMHALTRRGQSRAEVADLLARRELPPEVVETELERLTAVGLIDDHALAHDLVDRLRSRKKLGASALRAELQRRRLDREAIEAALTAVADDDADTELVDELARDRARRLGGLDRVTAERRLVDYLARKGHTGSRAREAARRALDGEGLRGGAAGGPGSGRRPVEFS